jgi:hypothetical protein
MKPAIARKHYSAIRKEIPRFAGSINRFGFFVSILCGQANKNQLKCTAVLNRMNFGYLQKYEFVFKDKHALKEASNIRKEEFDIFRNRLWPCFSWSPLSMIPSAFQEG